MADVLLDIDDNIAVITINRKEKHNALNNNTKIELKKAMLKATSNSTVKAIIITGAGEKAFVSGSDINELAERRPFEGKFHASKGQELFDLIENTPKPVIAAVNGYALGGGCELAMACHLRIASMNAKFGQPEVKLGLIPGYAGTQRLPRLVGKGRVLELILSGEMIDAEEAYNIGLVNRIVPFSEDLEIKKDGEKKQEPDLEAAKQKLLEEAKKLAREIIKNASKAISASIEAVNLGLEATQTAGQAIENSLFGIVLTTEDSKEGRRAYLEKRKPNWKNE